jgi:dienelactone hydrolase
MKTIIGEYGHLIESLISDSPGTLSFRNQKYTDLNRWKEKAVNISLKIISPPDKSKIGTIKTVCKNRYEWDGLIVEELTWQLPYGPETEALFLKTSDVKGELPGILALHDHSAEKFWGYKKIARGKDLPHKLMSEHHKEYYEGLCWANEIAKQGFAVLIHDVYSFASRRVHVRDVSANARRGAPMKEPITEKEIEMYNVWSSNHEHDMARSLFSAGTTWPGVTLAEDMVALDILSLRSDVDRNRLGCGGLSGGGLRTAYLGGFDQRVKCAVSVGFMTTWRDFSLYAAWTHTWMTFSPGLPGKLDFPEILGLRVPLPTMVLNNINDPLYTLEGMKDADRILKEVYRKANAEEKYHCSFYPGGHKFDGEMQKDAFSWFKKWLM